MEVSNLNTDVSVCKIHRYVSQDTYKFNESRICWHNSRMSAPSWKYFLFFHKNAKWECVKGCGARECQVKTWREKWKQFDETWETQSLKKKGSLVLMFTLQYRHFLCQNLKLLHTIHKHERSRWPVSCSREQDSPIFPPHGNARLPTQQQRNAAGREGFIDLFCMLTRDCNCANKQYFASLLFQPKSHP